MSRPLSRSRATVLATLLALALACALALAADAPAAKRSSTGGSTAALAFATSSIELQQPVEQWTPGWLLPCPEGQPDCRDDTSLWVSNPTGCAWDVDDHWVRRSNGGSLGAGRSTADAMCTIADCNGGQCAPFRYIGVHLTSPSADLTVALRVAGTTHEATRTWDATARLWRYDACAQPPVYDYGHPELQEIPGSNGGRGVPTELALSIANPSAKTAKVTGGWSIDHPNRGASC